MQKKRNYIVRYLSFVQGRSRIKKESKFHAINEMEKLSTALDYPLARLFFIFHLDAKCDGIGIYSIVSIK